MEIRDFDELAARSETLSRVVLHLAVQLEERGVIDGHRFQESVRAGRPSGSPTLDRAGQLMEELMGKYSTARSQRRATALWSANLPGRSE